MSSISIKTLQDRFLELNLSENQNDKAFRSPFFTDCGKYYQSTHTANCELIDDQFYQAALKVLQGKLFTDNPNTYARLSPSAKNYKASWRQLIKAFSLKNAGESELELKINVFVRSHVIFIQGLTHALRSTEERTSIGVKLNDPITVKTFYQAALEFLIQNPSRFAHMKKKVEESNPKLFDLLYHEVLLKHFQQSNPHQEIPEFFVPFQKEIANLKQQFQELPLDDQSNLNCAGLMNLKNTWDTKYLSEEGVKLFKAVREFMYKSQDDNNRNKFDLLYYEVLLKHFQQNDPHQEAPEYFAPFEKEIADLKQQFQTLPLDDQSKLMMNLKKTWDTKYLSEKGLKLFKAVREFIYTSQDGNNRNKFVMLNQIVFFLIATDLNIADEFKSSEALRDLEKPAGEIVDLEDIVSEVKILPKHLEMRERIKTAVFLKALSEAEYQRLEKANLVPSKNMVKRMPFRRIPKDTQFERIALMSALAVSLKKFKGDENPPAALVGNSLQV